MSTLPESRKAKIEYLEARIDQWIENAAAIGLTGAQVASLQGRITAARGDLDNVVAARAVSRDRTLEFHTSTDAMADLGADLIKMIRAYAETTKNPDVYALASIPAPATPTPAGPPVPPTGLTSTLTTDGTILLRWKGSLAAGTFFSVWRQTIPAAGGALTEFVQIGSVADKKFTDTTIPACVQATYVVRAHRGSAASTASEPTIVRLGQPGDAGAMAGTQDEDGLKLAA